MARVGTYYDPYRGHGVFIRFRPPVLVDHVIFCLRWRWHFYFIHPDARPGYSRLYVGPLEIEWSKRRQALEAHHEQ